MFLSVLSINVKFCFVVFFFPLPCGLCLITVRQCTKFMKIMSLLILRQSISFVFLEISSCYIVKAGPELTLLPRLAQMSPYKPGWPCSQNPTMSHCHILGIQTYTNNLCSQAYPHIHNWPLQRFLVPPHPLDPILFLLFCHIV